MTAYRGRAYTILILTAAIWGLAGPIIKFTLGGIAALPFLTYRFGLSSLGALISSKGLPLRLPHGRALQLEFIAYSLLTSTISLGLLFWALGKTTVLDLTLLGAAGPLFITLGGSIFLKEKITKKEKLGIGIVLIGVILTTVEPLVKNGMSLGQFSGNLIIILYLLVNSASSIMAKRLARADISAHDLANATFVIGFISILPFALYQLGPRLLTIIKNITLPYHLGVVYMALISGNLAYTLWVKGQKSIEVSEAALFAYLQPLFAAPLAILWLGETLSPTFIIGALIIASGIIVAEYKGTAFEF